VTACLLVWWQGQCCFEELDERSLARTFGSGDEDAVERVSMIAIRWVSWKSYLKASGSLRRRILRGDCMLAEILGA
jgi:hypothetical protein